MYTNYQGYVVATVKNHPFSDNRGRVLNHRLIMEQHLRENDPDHPALIEIDGELYLRPEWIPHHKNEVRNDNRSENLQVMTDFGHRSLHNVGEGNPMFGKDFSEIHRERLVTSHKKWWDDPNNKKAIEIRNKKISDALKGIEFSEEHKKKLRERIFTKEWRQKISDAKKGNIPWNKDLTAEMDERVAKYGRLVSKAKIGKPRAPHRSDCKCMFCLTKKGTKNPGFKKGNIPWNKVFKLKEYKETV